MAAYPSRSFEHCRIMSTPHKFVGTAKACNPSTGNNHGFLFTCPASFLRGCGEARGSGLQQSSASQHVEISRLR